ncbi:hypothetical protein RJ639_043763 [Escallonia herrerae]|uniref:RING-type E3 ubiquitin transferase n=1 Tax=Escallonia herrerae TaxID=1293975 RepID=A0AA88WAS1_9ASTE|nr:hypothetical protein RJ639_043763 [Escallonia herrerae]
MGFHQPPSPPHLYPQAIQLKLYQAFIFSIPILFTIILILLFYLFYLKRRTSPTSAPPTLPVSLNQATPFTSLNQMGLKGNLKDKLKVILFDEEFKMRDSLCCVCLGEFELKEELHQIPSCNHMFHIDCISHWLHSNSTCPLCRCSIVMATKLSCHSDSPVGANPVGQGEENISHNLLIASPQRHEQAVRRVATNLANCSRDEHVVVLIEAGSSSTASTSIRVDS